MAAIHWETKDKQAENALRRPQWTRGVETVGRHNFKPFANLDASGRLFVAVEGPSSVRRRFVVYCLLIGVAGLGALLASPEFLWPPFGELEGARAIKIPFCDHGYSNFESKVIRSRQEFDQFLKRVDLWGWHHQADFLNALKDAQIDFSKESLVLLRHTEGSGSIQVHFRRPFVVSSFARTLICPVERKVPIDCTCDIAEYCVALAIETDKVDNVAIRVDGKQREVLQLKID